MASYRIICHTGQRCLGCLDAVYTASYMCVYFKRNTVTARQSEQLIAETEINAIGKIGPDQTRPSRLDLNLYPTRPDPYPFLRD